VEKNTPCTSKLLAVEKGYTLHIHTAGSGKGYTLHIHTAGSETVQSSNARKDKCGQKPISIVLNYLGCFIQPAPNTLNAIQKSIDDFILYSDKVARF
jgi:hypothetical protein